MRTIPTPPPLPLPLHGPHDQPPQVGPADGRAALEAMVGRIPTGAWDRDMLDWAQRMMDPVEQAWVASLMWRALVAGHSEAAEQYELGPAEGRGQRA
jgi:hypothetical protein